MDQLGEITRTLALTMGVAWASGINLYASILMLGVLGSTGNMVLPPGLEILTDPMVFGAAGLMYFIEFFADKVPGIDSGWDAIHTFIRIPAGALLAAGAVGPVDPALALAAGILGGGLATATHVTKAGTRIMINMSPEPFTNGLASFGEDALVLAGIWSAVNHPVAFLCALILFLIALSWILPRIWRGVRALARRIASWFGRDSGPLESPPV
jgi:hypothetical protein